MKILLFVNLIIQRLKFRYKYIRLFIINLSFFLLNFRAFKTGKYIINSRVIIQKAYIEHEHFQKTIMNWKPTITLNNYLGSKESAISMIGFHPDLRYTIDFDNQTVTKSFYRDVNLLQYSGKRMAFSNYVAAPEYEIIDANQYREDLIIGKPFSLNQQNTNKFDMLLAEYNNFLCASVYRRDDNTDHRKEFSGISRRIDTLININKSLFNSLVFTNYFILSKGSDIAGPNIIEAEERLVLIDWEPSALKYRRFWVDVINLIIKSDPAGFTKGKYDLYLKELFSRFGIITSSPSEIEDKMAIFCASTLVNLKKLDEVDLRDDSEQLPCRGLTRISKLDIHQVARSARVFVRRFGLE